ncbi:hypothetical protein CKAN_01686600 [Cinnamomum micranthum f. kanehirae]|uniref:Uncharacterized protein n=1 Tax=Cinnamomum micranthum f. kanehirae TaxID=337451 RepID=A0A3S4PAR3_9MAGN|nr:hypothetical protein CKAN_01686600 [Cinnamomum micranthum f. kanehirae]
MRRIQCLSLYDCPNLNNIEGIRYHTGLQHLFLQKVSVELFRRICGDKGNGWRVIQHLRMLLTKLKSLLRGNDSTKGYRILLNDTTFKDVAALCYMLKF